MDNILQYGSSNSSDTQNSLLGSSNKRKRSVLTASHEESEVSSTVVQEDPKRTIDESTQNPTTLLIQMGCSIEQVEHAIKICGEETKVEDLFDFIQACNYPFEEGRSAMEMPLHEDLQAQQSITQCFSSPLYIASSSGSKEKGKLIMQTGEHTKEASSSRNHYVEESVQDCVQHTSILEELKLWGFTTAQVQRASEESNSIDFDVLLEFLLKETDCPLQSPTQPEVGKVDRMVRFEERSATPLERLKGMGYSPNAIQKASEECNSIDFDVLLEYLMGAKEKELQCPSQSEVDSSENEDSEIASASKLHDMGFPYPAITKAIDLCGSQDFDELLDVLNTSGSCKDKKAVDAVKESTQGGPFGETAYDSLLKNRISYAVEGCSRSEPVTTKWTKSMEKLWSSYIGSKKKNDFSPLSESDGSESELWESTWEDKLLKSKGSKRKLEFHQYKALDTLKPHLGKMMGYGIPGHYIGRPKPLPHLMHGPPYFYFENVASVPNKEWDTIKRHFNGVDPEFTDSKFFSASRRPRGYVHNLPIEGRTPLPCVPPMTISEAFPETQQYQPSWDTREKLNCINTRKAPDSLCGLIRKLFALHDGEDMPYHRQQEIVQACKKWNLVWVGPGQTAPLEPHEIELLLGFDRDHTRGCSSMTDRYDALGNSFQVDTVAYHLSTLKSLYPKGITVLSLFSGIGGAEVALHKLGIYLKVVIAVEINEKVRGVIASWWKKTGQKGELKLKNDVRDLTHDELADLVDEVGPIDLIIGGSPCNNLSGNNRVNRIGLSGSESSLFFEFPRILNIVTQVMRDRGWL